MNDIWNGSPLKVAMALFLSILCLGGLYLYKPPAGFGPLVILALGVASGMATLFYIGDILLGLLDQVIRSWVNGYERWWLIRSKTSQVAYLEALADLTPEQLRFVGDWRPIIEAIWGSHGPVYQVRISQTETISLLFVYEFLDRCTPTHLAPVGSWSEGPQRVQAQRLTAHFQTLGLAEKFTGGNQPAKWAHMGAYLAAMTGYGRIPIEEEAQ